MDILVVALNVLLLLSFFVVMVTLLVAIVEMLRTRRRAYLLVAIAVFGWALASWAGIAQAFAPRNSALAWFLFALVVVAQLIFVGLTLAVFHFVWGWLRRAKQE